MTIGNQGSPLPDFRRKVGEWRELVGDQSYIDAAAKYIRLGEGTHAATPADEALGLKEVYVGFFYCDGEPALSVGVEYKMKDDRTEFLSFDLDFNGFGE